MEFLAFVAGYATVVFVLCIGLFLLDVHHKDEEVKWLLFLCAFMWPIGGPALMAVFFVYYFVVLAKKLASFLKRNW
jgi:hypothetical protein